jgi:hypothetical protein
VGAIAACLLSAIPIIPTAQTDRGLVSLTVPEQTLPDGCRLEPVVISPTGETSFVMSPGVRENPWVGTSPVTGASIRQVVDGPAGPTYGLSGPALHARLGEDVLESYRARYLAADGSRIEVFAVRFKEAGLTAPAAMNRLDGDQRPRIVGGAAATLVFRSGDWRSRNETGDECLRAVQEHVTRLLQRRPGGDRRP